MGRIKENHFRIIVPLEFDNYRSKRGLLIKLYKTIYCFSFNANSPDQLFNYKLEDFVSDTVTPHEVGEKCKKIVGTLYGKNIMGLFARDNHRIKELSSMYDNGMFRSKPYIQFNTEDFPVRELSKIFSLKTLILNKENIKKGKIELF